LTTDDEAQADTVAQLVHDLFGLEATSVWARGRWRISFYAHDVRAFLGYLGITSGRAAHFKHVPDVVLRSPREVVAAFLAAYSDCAGYTDSQGVMLSTSSEALSRTIQVLLMNFGILSSRRAQQDGCWHIHTTGASAARFCEAIGFGVQHKQQALQHSLEDRQWFKREAWDDPIVAIEQRRADVYDISVSETHRYAAQGFINHNSYWHSEIMTKRAAQASEIVSFADLHSGVVATSGNRLNPYKLGLEMLRHIEERWNKGRFGKDYEECDDIREKLQWDTQAGLGREKLFEIRRLYNDVTFIDEFLTPEFVLEQKLFTFRYNRDTDLYEIASREFQEVKEKLLFRLTNFGQPFIAIEDANYNNRGELYLKHRHEGVDLQPDYARETMRNLQKLWTRPVHVETVIDEKKRLLTFDGSDFSERRID
jgi:stage V sporulation protein R